MAKEIKKTSEVTIRCPECNVEERWPLEAFRLRLRFSGGEATSGFLEIPDVYCLKCHICCEIKVEDMVYE